MHPANTTHSIIPCRAQIVVEIMNETHGGRGYSSRNPEGHLWNFGSYDPWANTDA